MATDHINEYEQKQQERKERLERRAALCLKLSNLRHEQAKRMASVIPFGQPILIGHHCDSINCQTCGKVIVAPERGSK